jgi:methionyl-tRNA formyltransferase
VRIAFFGTGMVSAAYLQTLIDDDFEVSVVVTKTPKRRSRSGSAEPTPVAALGDRLGLPVLTTLAELDAMGQATPGSGDALFDLGIVVAYGRILPVELAVYYKKKKHTSPT